ncbi:MAG: hypothetical protein J6B45_04115, partial [Clostridia bacterium]|nr:hypothetical protein [Clostridia bacterium]
MKKLLVLVFALISVLALTFAISAVCYDDYELGDLGKMENYYGEAEVKDEGGTYLGGYQGGGNNRFSSIFDNNTTNTGWAGGAAPRYNGTYNMTFFYAESHLIRETTVYFNVNAQGGGFTVELSNDGGATWTEVGTFVATDDQNGTVVPVTFSVNGGAGMMADTYRFTWNGKYQTFQVSVVEIDIKASTVLSCQEDGGVVTTPVDCGTDGVTVYTCTKCGDTREVITEATGVHTWDEGVVTKEATEEEDGIRTYTCTVCSATYEETISAIQHVYVATVTPPTCTEKGYTTYTCNGECGVENCDATYVDQKSIVAELGHSYVGEITVKPTAINTGIRTNTCSVCGDSYTEVLAKLSWGDSAYTIGSNNIVSVEYNYNGTGHANSDAYKLFDGKINSTWTQGTGDGWFGPSGSSVTITLDKEYYIISFDFRVWSNWNTATIKLLDADGKQVASQGFSGLSCTAPQDELKSASALAGVARVKSIVIVNDSAKGDFGQCCAFQEFYIVAHACDEAGDKLNYIAPTCTTTGSYAQACSICGITNQVQVPALGHTWTETSRVDATCTENGTIYYACNVCDLGATKEETIDAFGHTKDEAVEGVVTAPTCTEDGYTTYVCATCGENYKADEQAATGHSYFYACDVRCEVCGEETNPEATHTLVHVEAVAATCTENGNVEYWYCSVCGYAWTDEACTQVTNQRSVIVPATGHSYFYACDVRCEVCGEETNPEATHTLVHVEAVAATCTENG